MATLEQELLADFEDVGSEDEAQGNGYVDSDVKDLEQDFADSPLQVEDEEAEMVDEEAEYEATNKLKGPVDIEGASALISKLQPVLKEIEHYKENPETMDNRSIEENPEYQLLTSANTLSTTIDAEVHTVHKFIRDHYSVRFPYLEELIKNPLDYAKTVAIIGNGPMEDIKTIARSADNLVGKPLREILDGPSLMVITVEATNAGGHDLDESKLALIRKACVIMLELDRSKKILTDYVQSRMSIFAPNLTILVGSLTAAQLLNFAGGLKGLAKMSNSNIPALGSKTASGIGMATNVTVRHQGFLYYSPIVQGVRYDLRKQAMRIVSGKLLLAARTDLVHQFPDGGMGVDLKDQCMTRIDHLTQTAPNKGVRALPAPDDKPARKRGGRRARKAKEAVAQTDLAKARNRMEFGKEEREVGYGDTTTGLGMIGAQDSGRLRAQQVDDRTKAKLSKKNPGWGGATTVGGPNASLVGGGNATAVLRGHGLRAAGVGGPATGTSSIAFTPVQGLELVDPKVKDEMNRKRKAEDDRWFKGGAFTQIGNEGDTPAKVDAGGFKVPGLPPNKKVDIGKTKG